MARKTLHLLLKLLAALLTLAAALAASAALSSCHSGARVELSAFGVSVGVKFAEDKAEEPLLSAAARVLPAPSQAPVQEPVTPPTEENKLTR